MRVMGILNVTPDSFSDGGSYASVDAALAAAERLLAEGAHLVDVGGESTRPGAAPVDEEEELRRVVPVLQALGRRGLPVSVDTRRAAVARRAIEAGATVVNDVSGGADPAMFPLVAASGCTYVLMHTRGTPATMGALARYEDPDAEVWAELEARRDAALALGVRPEQLWLDPGIGFAKETDHNLAVLRGLPRHTAAHRVLVGASRKRFIGALTGQADPAARLEGSLAVALWAAQAGAYAVRVHDVAATVRALAVWRAVAGEA